MRYIQDVERMVDHGSKPQEAALASLSAWPRSESQNYLRRPRRLDPARKLPFHSTRK